MYAKYARQIILPEVGVEGQKKLQQAKVLCVGAGGLGCSALMYLAASGIGTIGIADGDIIQEHNLQRQVLYTEQDIGQLKSVVAVSRLKQLNREIEFINIPEYISFDNGFSFLADYDFIIDATDNFTIKFLLNDVCHYLHKPLISASVQQFSGYCTTFWFPHSGCLRCLFDPVDITLPNCAQAGVMGVMPGLFGTLQALEVMKLCLDLPNQLIGKLWRWEVLQGLPKLYKFTTHSNCPLCTGQESFVTLWNQLQFNEGMGVISEMTAAELAAKLTQQGSLFVLDVRNPDEYIAYNIGGYLIPLAELPQRLSEIPRNQPIVVHCRSGHRSQTAVQFLQQAGFENVKNLTGGILAWQKISHPA
ncbi:MAG: ThiF family adenylyltransferase [Candidatus Berkiellales bacterium]